MPSKRGKWKRKAEEAGRRESECKGFDILPSVQDAQSLKVAK